MINLSPTENNLVKFNLSISGTKAVPSSVRFLVGDDLSKIAFSALPSGGSPNEWCATVYPLSDFMFHFSNGLIYATVEVILNGRTIVVYNKPINISKEIEQIEVKSEPVPDPVDISAETHRVEPPEEPVVVMPTEVNKPIEQTSEEKIVIKPSSLMKDVIVKEEKKSEIKEEKKPKLFKKQFKLTPFTEKSKVRITENTSIEKMIKDVVSINDVTIKPIEFKIEKTIINKEAPFKITKKEIVYK